MAKGSTRRVNLHALIIDAWEVFWPYGCPRLWSEWSQALAGDNVLYSWARHLTLTVPLFT